MTLQTAIATLAGLNETELAARVRRAGAAVESEAVAYADICREEIDEDGELLRGQASLERLGGAKDTLLSALDTVED